MRVPAEGHSAEHHGCMLKKEKPAPKTPGRCFLGGQETLPVLGDNCCAKGRRGEAEWAQTNALF